MTEVHPFYSIVSRHWTGSLKAELHDFLSSSNTVIHLPAYLCECRLECETIKVNVFLIYWMWELKIFCSSSGRSHLSHVTSDDSLADDMLLRNWVLWGVRDREWEAECVRAERSRGVCVCVWWLEQVEAQIVPAPHTLLHCHRLSEHQINISARNTCTKQQKLIILKSFTN